VAHTFTNLGFEVPELVPGDAFAWEQSIVSTLIEHANFGYSSASPFDTWEEGWDNADFLFLFAQTDLLQGQFPSGTIDPLVADGFEYGWDNNTFAFGLGAIDDAEFDAGSVTDENFENDWDNNTWSGVLGSIAVGMFDAGANDHESFDFAFPQNAFGYWPALSEVQGDFVDGLDGSSPSTLPVGCTFVDGPRRIQLPAGFTAGGGKGFLEVGFKAGDNIGGVGSDINGADLWTIQTTPTNEEVTVQGANWVSPGTNTTPMRIHEMWPAALVDGRDIPPLGVLDDSEYFDASTFDEMDTM
jgi:hypothetical protein